MVLFFSAARCVQGGGGGIVNAVALSMLSDQFPKNKGKVLGVASTAGSMAFFVGPPVGGILYELGGFRLPFILSAVLPPVCCEYCHSSGRADAAAAALFASYSTAGPCFACDWRKWGTNCSRGCRNVWVRKSTDKGASWGVPQNVSGAIFDSAVAGTPAAIGEFVNAGPTKGLQLADGTLVMVIVDLSAPKPGFPGGGILSIRSSDH